MRTKSRYPWLAGLTILSLAGACGGGEEAATATVASSAAEGPSSAARARVERPYKGRCETRFAITAPVLQGEPPQQVGFMVRLSGTCQLTHLGRTSLEAEQTVLFRTPTEQAVTNEATLTAANGDTLHSSFAGIGTPILADASNPPTVIGFTFSGTDTYSPGTGRFGAASGTATLTGSAQFDPPGSDGAPPTTGAGSYEVAGTIAY